MPKQSQRWHEVADRLNILIHNLSEHVVSHEVSSFDRKFLQHALKARDELMDAYQRAGANMHAAATREEQEEECG